MSLRFDATLKAIVTGHPGDFAAVFGLPTVEPVTPINVDLSTLSAATDVALAYGDPVRTIVDLNFQSGPDAALPNRLHLYNAALNFKYNVAVRSILVLLQPKADGTHLTGSLTYGADGSRVEFWYEVIRLWQQPVDAFLHAGLSLLPLAVLCQMPGDRPLPDALREVIRAIEQRLIREAPHAEAARLMTAAFILTGLRVKKSGLKDIYRGAGLMFESAAYEVWIEEGEIKQSHYVLLRLGQKRFGPADAATEAELKAIEDLDRLNRMIDTVHEVKSWQELLATP